MKRTLKKQLKEDEFVSTISKIMEFTANHSRILIGAAALIVLALISFVVIQAVKSANLKKESLKLAQIIEVSEDLANNPDNIQKLEELAGNGKFSRVARIKLASYQVEQGEYDTALQELAKIRNGGKDIFACQALDLKAKIFTIQEKYDEALSIYTEMEKNPGEYSLDIILFHKAEVYEARGDAANALEIYKRLKEDFPQTYYGYEASQKILKIEGKK